MHLSTAQLAALAAVLREGSFEGAARALHVTSPAISQRIKQLEAEVGTVLVVRGSPCVATAAGAAVHRHALQVELLERDLLQAVAPDPEQGAQAPLSLAIAVNADSLATWLIPALERFCAETHARIDVSVEDQEHTPQLLRAGKVLGVVTSSARAVQGCAVHPLGVMRYQATASPRFIRRWLPEGVSAKAMRDLPCLAYNRRDSLCAQFLAKQLRAKSVDLLPHFLPSPEAYVDATLRGLGWGMNPALLVAPHLRRRRLVDLFPGQGIDVPLYWQQWSIASRTIAQLGAALREGASASLLALA